MKILFFALGVSISFSSFAHDYDFKKNLKAIEVTCTSLRAWASRTTCYQVGVQGVINEEGYTTYAPRMCNALRGWAPKASCYSSIIDQLGDEHARREKSLCLKMYGRSNKVTCYRDYFSDSN